MYFKQYPEVFELDLGDGWLGVFQPTALGGVQALSRESAWIYRMVANYHEVQDLWSKAKCESSQVKQDTINKILTDLETRGLIYQDTSKPIQVNPNRPKVLGVWFHVTNQCNLRCVYCYVKKTNESMSIVLANKLIKKILFDAKKNGFMTVKFKFSGGEALLRYGELVQMISMAQLEGERLGVKVQAVVLTNAVLMTEKRAGELEKLGARVMVSLDGLQKAHDRVRVFPGGKGSYKQVWQGIENLLIMNVPFNLSVTITDKNVSGIPALTRKLLKRKIPFVYNFFRENCLAGSELMSAETELIKYMKLAYQEIEKELPDYSIIGGLLDRVSYGGPHLSTCGIGQNYLVVDHKGRIASCPTVIRQTIGMVMEGDVIETMQKKCVVPEKNRQVELKVGGCQKCLWRYICGGGCPLLTRDVYGDFGQRSPYCRVYKELIPLVLRLEGLRLKKYGMKLKRKEN